MFTLKSSFNVTSFGKITTAVVRRAVRAILSKICTRWYKIALSREHVVPMVGGFIFAVQYIFSLAFFTVL